MCEYVSVVRWGLGLGDGICVPVTVITFSINIKDGLMLMLCLRRASGGGCMLTHGSIIKGISRSNRPIHPLKIIRSLR